MKLGEIVQHIKRQFGDEVSAQITDEDIVRWTNTAMLEIVTANASNQGVSGTTPVVVGTREYALPSDLYLLRSVRCNGIKLRHENYEQLCEMDPSIDSTTGDPTHYWVYGGKVNLYPTPSQALGNLQIMYVKTPVVIATYDADVVPDVPVQYHPRILEYCIAQAAELDDNLGHYQIKMEEFKRNISSLKQNAENPEDDGVYPSITYVGEYEYYGLY